MASSAAHQVMVDPVGGLHLEDPIAGCSDPRVISSAARRALGPGTGIKSRSRHLVAALRPCDEWESRQPASVRKFLSSVPDMTLTVVRTLKGEGVADGGAPSDEMARREEAGRRGVRVADLPAAPDTLGFSRPCALCLAVIRRCSFVKKVVFTTGDGAKVSELRRGEMREGHMSYSQRVVAARALVSRSGTVGKPGK